ncbi:ZIP zinc/iron transport family [Mollisia scopiformis]|uniref:ZIP zinc/iron transport family n=1 Tax=Mollisia scopiformis TaxID=149040 RepID=A0A194XNS5_MOLSC|nr:ZIP zinc/iron transport family [Mollisia scopiformis]KUJ21885.1 ZIP zinc/iron transport family [Mollisia scopiformis]
MSAVPTVVVECDNGNGFDGRLGLRVSSVFVIGIGSMLGALLPIAAARTKRMHVPPVAFFITKYFGSGVIIATAFIHLLSPATQALQSPCLTGPITDYSWAEGIALMTVFTMFFIELMAARFDIFGHQDSGVEASDPSLNLLRDSEKLAENSENSVDKTANMELSTRSHDHEESTASSSRPTTSTHNPAGSGAPASRVNSRIPGREDDFTYPPGGENHLGHQAEHDIDDDHFAAQMTAIFILEFGVIFHSVFIGLTLAVAGSEFTVLYIVLTFHQTFEGLGLGSRLATAQWPSKKKWMPWALGTAYGLATPLAIAIGLAARTSFTPGSNKTLIIQGVFDSISAGILIYTGLVELMAHEFMFNPEMRKSSIKMMLFAYLCMCVGAGLMALLGKWA